MKLPIEREKYFNIFAGLQEGFPVLTLLTIFYSERETLEREERFWHRAERTVACCRYQGEKDKMTEWETKAGLNECFFLDPFQTAHRKC